MQPPIAESWQSGRRTRRGRLRGGAAARTGHATQQAVTRLGGTELWRAATQAARVAGGPHLTEGQSPAAVRLC